METTPPGDWLLTEEQAARILGVSKKTLRNWRWQGGCGPAFTRIGRRMIRYRYSDLLAFIAAGMRRSTSDMGEAA